MDVLRGLVPYLFTFCRPKSGLELSRACRLVKFSGDSSVHEASEQSAHNKWAQCLTRETTRQTMTRIFDNIEQDRLTTLRGTIQVVK